MRIPKEFFDRCCPSFQKVINELAKKIADIQSQSGVDYDLRNEKEQLAGYEFYTAYYAPIEFLAYYRMFEKDLKWFEERGLLEIYLYHHECFEDTWRKREQDSSKFIFAWEHDFFELRDQLQMGDIFTDERDLSYPNSLLDQFFDLYERHTARPVSKQLVQKYEEMKALYTRIKAAEDDVQKWFNLLLEVGIDEFVYQVVEHRILGNLFDVKLWKIYLKHLKETNPQKMLLCYSKYCRFFLDDAEMKAEYKDELEKYDGHVLLPWANLFDFEKTAFAKTVLNDSNEKIAHIAVAPSDLEEIIQNVENLKVQNLVTVYPEGQHRSMKEICYGFYENEICKPAFSFKKPIIDYIREKANPIVLQKLFKSSKWFFAKQPTPICYSMDWRDRWNAAKAGATYVNEKLVFKFEDGKNDFPRNIVIATVFGFHDCGSPPVDYLSKQIIPRIHRCEAKYIDIKNQNITFKDLLLLIEHGNVHIFRMHYCEIMGDDGKLVLVENIMNLLPNVVNFDLNPARCGANTGHALANMKFNKKISEFAMLDIEGEPFDPIEFKKFFDANKSDDFVSYMYFTDDFAKEFVQKSQSIMGFRVE